MSSTRYRRLAPLRHRLLLESVDVECRAEALEDIMRDPELPGHIVANLGDVVSRLRDEARYLRRARRELR